MEEIEKSLLFRLANLLKDNSTMYKTEAQIVSYDILYAKSLAVTLLSFNEKDIRALRYPCDHTLRATKPMYQ